MGDDPTLAASRDLREIGRLAGMLEDQALHRYADKRVPGGEAMFELGPVSRLLASVSMADAIEWVERWNSDHYGEPGTVDLSHLNDEQDVVSLTNLLWWSDDWRERTGSQKPSRPTIAGEAKWLASALDWAVDNGEPVHELADMASDVRRRLEDEVKAGVRSERTRVRCIDCGARLLKIYADRARHDHWRCPNQECDRDRYDRDEFIRAKHAMLADEGADRFILVPDAIAAVKPRPEHTVRTWINRLLVRRVCDLETRQVMVWWPDVRRLNDEATRRTARRRRKVA